MKMRKPMGGPILFITTNGFGEQLPEWAIDITTKKESVKWRGTDEKKAQVIEAYEVCQPYSRNLNGDRQRYCRRV